MTNKSIFSKIALGASALAISCIISGAAFAAGGVDPSGTTPGGLNGHIPLFQLQPVVNPPLPPVVTPPTPVTLNPNNILPPGQQTQPTILSAQQQTLGINSITPGGQSTATGATVLLVRRSDLVNLVKSNQAGCGMDVKNTEDTSAITIRENRCDARQNGADVLVVELANGDLVRQQNAVGAFVDNYDLTNTDRDALEASGISTTKL